MLDAITLGMLLAWLGGESGSSIRVIPIALEPRTKLVVRADAEDETYSLIVGSTATSGEPHSVRVSVERTKAEEESIPETVDRPTPGWISRVERDRATQERSRKRQARSPDVYSVGKFAPRRTFHLYVGSRDLHDESEYRSVEARLAAVGEHCAVYVDPASENAMGLVEDVVQTFDDRVYPSAVATFGRHRDVDRNGKFTILLTSWLSRLSDGRVSLTGFVRGTDFFRDVQPPFSNQCDMMYLNADTVDRSHLRTVLAHEYTHAITFSEHTFGEYLPGGQGRDEQAWLSEAIAHLAENLHGEGWSNLDYRISTYLSDPSRYRLVVEDYYADGLWRCHGCRGATYLFLRYCVDRFGTKLLKDLSQSNLEGIENIETATGTPFEALFRDWTVTLATATCPNASTGAPLVGPVGERFLVGARPVTLSVESQMLRIAPTSWTSCIITAKQGEAIEIIIEQNDPSIQVTLVRMPCPWRDVRLAIHVPDVSKRVARLTLEGTDIDWQMLAWERLRLRQENPKENEKAAFALPFPAVNARTCDIDLTDFGSDPVVFKAMGRDADGRIVSIWGIDDPNNETDQPSLLRAQSSALTGQ